MDILKEYAVTLVATLIFITAIELIGPDNSMKKYLKFVMGLILMAVILNPIIKFLTNGETTLNQIIDKYDKDVSVAVSKDGINQNDNLRTENFKNNINKSIVKTLEEKFDKYSFTSDIDCSVDFEKMTYEAKKLRIGVGEKGVKTVEKVEINSHKDTKNTSNPDFDKIRDYISEELKISKDKIEVYKS